MEDEIIFVSIIVMSISIIPTVIKNAKRRHCSIPYLTSIPTSISLLVISSCFFSIGLLLSGIIQCFTGIMWCIIALQRVIIYVSFDKLPGN